MLSALRLTFIQHVLANAKMTSLQQQTAVGSLFHHNKDCFLNGTQAQFLNI